MSQTFAQKKGIKARETPGPVPVTDAEGTMPMWSVVGHGCPREFIEAPSEEMAAFFYRERFGINQSRPLDQLTISQADI